MWSTCARARARSTGGHARTRTSAQERTRSHTLAHARTSSHTLAHARTRSHTLARLLNALSQARTRTPSHTATFESWLDHAISPSTKFQTKLMEVRLPRRLGREDARRRPLLLLPRVRLGRRL
eukprot:6201178-Pleurochrysis_carterae.AAC.1